METATIVTINGGKCDTAAIGTARFSRRPSRPCACASARRCQQRRLATAEPPSSALWRPFLYEKEPAILRQPLWSERSAPAGWSPPRPAALSVASTFSQSRVPLVQPSTPAADSATGPSPKPAKTSAPFQGRHRRKPTAQSAATAVGPTAWLANGRLGLAKGRRLGPAVGPATPPPGPSSRLAVGATLRGVGRQLTPRPGVFTTGDSVALA